MGLAVLIRAFGAAALVEEELGLVEVFLVACNQIEFSQCHLGNLMTGHTLQLIFIRTNGFADAIGITDGDVEEIALACGLIVGDGALDHVTEVIELVTEVFHLVPAMFASPLVGMFRILRTGRVEIAVGFLCGSHEVDDAVDVVFHLLVGIGLQQVGGSLDGFVHVGVVEAVAFHLEAEVRVGVHLLGGVDEVRIAALALTLAEGERDGDLARGLKSLSPECSRGHFDGSEGNGGDGVSAGSTFQVGLPVATTQQCHGRKKNQ